MLRGLGLVHNTAQPVSPNCCLPNTVLLCAITEPVCCAASACAWCCQLSYTTGALPHELMQLMMMAGGMGGFPGMGPPFMAEGGDDEYESDEGSWKVRSHTTAAA